ncbi:hypothetical protein [uncultured Tenacibaculum sp.]|uniref:hypothetical protein n=1 Tax=uncultured Tenacibaculum sp. TaxID=174713 RepID=UPI002627B612|nr:hypothetical protein [uncultured Tenacibaculum sp.]
MKKSILNLGKALNKQQQQEISGGFGATCPQYSALQCTTCGGFSLPNGCCLGTSETHCCLSDICE